MNSTGTASEVAKGSPFAFVAFITDHGNICAAGERVKMEFQTETSRILDIMTNSLYTDKEVATIGFV